MTLTLDRPDLEAVLRAVGEGLTDPAAALADLERRSAARLARGAGTDHTTLYQPFEGPSEAPPAPSGADPAPEAPGGMARYAVAGEIGRGGMGAILEARDPDLERAVALKVLLDGPEASPQRRGKFLLEARVTGQLEHPGIVPVHELGRREDGTPFFAMKLVRGVSLASVIEGLAHQRPGMEAWSRARLLRDFARICEAVAFAHSKGVIHRDLKPALVRQDCRTRPAAGGPGGRAGGAAGGRGPGWPSPT